MDDVPARFLPSLKPPSARLAQTLTVEPATTALMALPATTVVPTATATVSRSPAAAVPTGISTSSSSTSSSATDPTVVFQDVAALATGTEVARSANWAGRPVDGAAVVPSR